MSYYKAPKARKSEREEKTPYTTYWIHSCPFNTPRISADPDKEICVSVDPGTKNLAIRAEERNTQGITRPLLFVKWNLYDKVPDSPKDFVTIIGACIRNLDSYKSILERADRVIIERQLAINYRSTLIMQTIVTYFHILLMDKPNLPLIHTIHPLVKGKVFGYNKKIDGDLKVWSPMKAVEIFNQRGDMWSLQVMTGTYRKKQDDVADVTLQAESLYILENSPFKSKLGMTVNASVIVIEDSDILC